MRQTVRLDEVRAPRAPNDALGPDVVLATDQAASTLAEHYDSVLTQIRSLLGAASWRDQPVASVSSLESSRRTTALALYSQNQSLAALAQEQDAQGRALDALQQATQSVLQAQTLIASLQRTVADVAASAASKDDLSVLAAQVADLDSGLNAALASLKLRVSGLESQADLDDRRLAALESQNGSYVTASGLQYALSHAYVNGQLLSGTRDRKNLVFQASATFYTATLTVFYNGQVLRRSDDGDYIVEAASSSLTSDTIRLLHAEAAPHVQDILTASFMPV